MNINELQPGSYKIIPTNSNSRSVQNEQGKRQPEQKKSFVDKVGGFIGSIAAPFTKTVGSGVRGIQSIPEVAKEGVALIKSKGQPTYSGSKADEIQKKPIFGQKTFSGSTPLENLGTAAEAGSFLIGGSAVKGVAKGLVKQSAIQGTKAGALQGGGQYLSNTEKPTVGGAIGATAIGGALGGATGGALGALAGRPARVVAKNETNLFNRVTPKVNELTPTEYEGFLNAKKILPKTNTNPAQYILSESEKANAVKYQKLLTSDDPVKNSVNVINEIVDKDKLVGQYLQKNNRPFNNGELKNYILDKLKEIDDINVDPARLTQAKETLVDNFIRVLPKNNQVTLWSARKGYDRSIEKVFSGSPSLQNTVKKEFRNAIQDFISEYTDDVTYKAYMKDMRELFDIRDVINNKASKEKNYSALRLWIKNNPTKAKVIGWGSAALGGTAITGAIIN